MNEEEGDVMRPIGLVQSLLRQEKTSESRVLAFRPGQIFNGKVLKLYPNQIAEVQVGTQKVIAHLETPLSVDERHWFQVQAGDGKVHLRVLDTSNGVGKPSSVDALLSQMNLQVSKDNIALAQLFIKEQFPLSKETIGSASEWLKLSDSLQEGLQIIKLLLSKQLPFTKDVFLSLSSVLKDDPLSTQLTNLQLHLKNEQTAASNDRLLSLLNEMNMTGKEKETNSVLQRIVQEWLFSNEKTNTAFNLLQNLGFVSKTASNEEMINQVFAKMLNKEYSLSSKEGKMIAEQSLLTEIITQNKAGNREAVILSLVKLLNQMKSNSDISTQNKGLNDLQQLLSEIRSNQLAIPLNESKLTLLAREIFRSLNSNINSVANQSENIIQTFLSINSKHADEGLRGLTAAMKMSESIPSNAISNEEHTLLMRIKNEVQTESLQLGNSLAIKEQMKSMMKVLGLSYEHDLVNLLKQHEGEGMTKLESLKPLLMQLMNEEIPNPIREVAERLLYKITGFQVLSQEAGPIMQFVFQLPLSLSDSRTDLTMQWSGRKTKEGKIDPNYCRVLFYLQLDNIEETIIDMQVQNRIMNISIINERNDLKWIASPFLAELKEGLGKINYQLSSVTFDKPAKEKQKNEMKDTLATIVVPNQVNGVDYRI